MLTQCPECKTTFRLHVKQLKAAGGKVRCSRCHATFDALDNLFEAPPVNEQVQEPQPAAPDVTEQITPEVKTTPPEPTPTKAETPEAAAPLSSTPEPEPTPAKESEDDKERITSIFDEPPPTSDTVDDPLDVLIDELEARASVEELPAEEPEFPSPALDAFPTSSTDEIFSAALDSIADTPVTASFDSQSIEQMLVEEPLTEPEEEVAEISLELITDEPAIELVDEEPLPLVEVEEEPAEISLEPVAEELTIEPVDEEPLPLVELEEDAAELSIEPVPEELTIEPVDEEPLPLVELEEEATELNIEPVAEQLTIELVDEEPATELSIDPLEDELTIESVESEATEPEPEIAVSEIELDSFFEETEPEEEMPTPIELDSEAEPAISEDELDSFFEESEPEEEAPTPIELDSEAEPAISETELDSFFEESEPEEDAPTPIELDSEAEAAISETELDSFFEESEPELAEEELLTDQDNMFDLFDEEPTEETIAEELTEGPIEIDDEAAMDEVLLPEEPEEPAAADPLAPFSEEQIEHMLSPSEEQQASRPPPARPPAKPSTDKLELDTGNRVEPALISETTTTQPAAVGYAMPTELTQTKQTSSTGTVLWGLGIILMCAALVLQYLYYFRLQLVDNPQLRPVLSTMCNVTGCVLPPRRDLGHIELADHLMQFHPTYEESLLITATLENSADFDQPYPLLEVIMTDIEQQVVARRHFPPRQYLNNFSNGDSFAAHSEVPLLLEVLDPGNSAVGFEFRFY